MHSIKSFLPNHFIKSAFCPDSVLIFRELFCRSICIALWRWLSAVYSPQFNVYILSLFLIDSKLHAIVFRYVSILSNAIHLSKPSYKDQGCWTPEFWWCFVNAETLTHHFNSLKSWQTFPCLIDSHQIPVSSHNEWVAWLVMTEVSNSFYYSEIYFNSTEIQFSFLPYTHTHHTYAYLHATNLDMSHM